MDGAWSYIILFLNLKNDAVRKEHNVGSPSAIVPKTARKRRGGLIEYNTNKEYEVF